MDEEKGREGHVRHAYATRKVEIDERGNTRFVARERVDLEDRWLATRFTPTLRLCISGCVRSTRRPSSSVFVAPERDLRPHGWWWNAPAHPSERSSALLLRPFETGIGTSSSLFLLSLSFSLSPSLLLSLSLSLSRSLLFSSSFFV